MMKPVYLFLLISLFSFTSPQPSIEVYIFMGEECIISQYYTLNLKRLWQAHASEDIRFYGLFPNPSSSPTKIKAFREKYEIPFDLSLDFQQEKMSRFGVEVTPEVVVFDASAHQVIYQGRIDNTYFRVGRRRAVTTTAELEDVLKALHFEHSPAVAKTEAVGCYITKLQSLSSDVPMCKPRSNQ